MRKFRWWRSDCAPLAQRRSLLSQSGAAGAATDWVTISIASMLSRTPAMRLNLRDWRRMARQIDLVTLHWQRAWREELSTAVELTLRHRGPVGDSRWFERGDGR